MPCRPRRRSDRHPAPPSLDAGRRPVIDPDTSGSPRLGPAPQRSRVRGIAHGSTTRRSMSETPSFFTALKQRKIVQWTLAYAAGAFAVLQGIDIVAQQFGWPEGPS